MISAPSLRASPWGDRSAPVAPAPVGLPQTRAQSKRHCPELASWEQKGVEHWNHLEVMSWCHSCPELGEEVLEFVMNNRLDGPNLVELAKADLVEAGIEARLVKSLKLKPPYGSCGSTIFGELIRHSSSENLEEQQKISGSAAVQTRGSKRRKANVLSGQPKSPLNQTRDPIATDNTPVAGLRCWVCLN